MKTLFLKCTQKMTSSVQGTKQKTKPTNFSRTAKTKTYELENSKNRSDNCGSSRWSSEVHWSCFMVA